MASETSLEFLRLDVSPVSLSLEDLQVLGKLFEGMRDIAPKFAGWLAGIVYDEADKRQKGGPRPSIRPTIPLFLWSTKDLSDGLLVARTLYAQTWQTPELQEFLRSVAKTIIAYVATLMAAGQ